MIRADTMAPPGRSFWALLSLAATAVAASLPGAVWATRDVLACWWAPLAGAHFKPGAVCATSVWGIGHRAWIPASVLVGLAGLGVVCMVVQVLRQLLGARALRARFGPELTPTPEALASTAYRAGIYRLVVIEDDREFCLCEGLWRPRVVISSSLVARLDPAQCLAVLAHEASHAHHFDPLALLVARAAGAGLWFVPLRRRLLRVCEIRAELAADADAVQVAGRSALAGALLAMGETAAQAPSAMAHAASTPDVLAMRIAALWSQGLPKACVITRLVVANAVVLGLVAATMVAWAGPPTYQAPLAGHVRVLPSNISRNDLLPSHP